MQLGKLPRSHISGHGSAVCLYGLTEKRQVPEVNMNRRRILTARIDVYLRTENLRGKIASRSI